jgi:hypothetical protein
VRTFAPKPPTPQAASPRFTKPARLPLPETLDRESGAENGTTRSKAADFPHFRHSFDRIPLYDRTETETRHGARGDQPGSAGYLPPETSGAVSGNAAGGGQNDATPGGDSSGVATQAGPSTELPGAPSACVVEANTAIPYSRSGILRDSGGNVGERFEVRVEWQNTPAALRGDSSYCAAECGEYHQFIKGHMFSSSNADGSNPTDVGANVFGGQALDENTFREDGLDRNPAARYGHRAEKQTMDETFTPDRATGTKYVGRDFPRVMIGTFADIDVTFEGRLADTCNNTETVAGTWRVQYRGVIRP